MPPLMPHPGGVADHPPWVMPVPPLRP